MYQFTPWKLVVTQIPVFFRIGISYPLTCTRFLLPYYPDEQDKYVLIDSRS